MCCIKNIFNALSLRREAKQILKEIKYHYPVWYVVFGHPRFFKGVKGKIGFLLEYERIKEVANESFIDIILRSCK